MLWKYYRERVTRVWEIPPSVSPWWASSIQDTATSWIVLYKSKSVRLELWHDSDQVSDFFFFSIGGDPEQALWALTLSWWSRVAKLCTGFCVFFFCPLPPPPSAGCTCKWKSAAFWGEWVWVGLPCSVTFVFYELYVQRGFLQFCFAPFGWLFEGNTFKITEFTFVYH